MVWAVSPLLCELFPPASAFEGIKTVSSISASVSSLTDFILCMLIHASFPGGNTCIPVEICYHSFQKSQKIQMNELTAFA